MTIHQFTLDELLEEAPRFSAIVSRQNEAEVPSDQLNTSKWGDQVRAVYEVMRDGRWRTLAEIAFHAKAPEASASARIRDLKRKGIDHEKRKASGGSLYEYRHFASHPDMPANLGNGSVAFLHS
jgi:hypothetical protein